MSDDTRPRIEVTIAAPADVVWDALRDKDKIRHWHGWDYDGLDGEIDLIFFTETLQDASARTLRLHGGGPRPTARSSDSTAPWPANGPTRSSTPANQPAAPPSPHGSINTITTGPTPRSDAQRPSPG